MRIEYITIKSVSVLAISLLTGSVACAAPSDLEVLYTKAHTYSDYKKYGKADQIYSSIAPKFEKKYGNKSNRTIALYFRWAENCQRLGQNKKAIALFKKVIASGSKESKQAKVYELLGDSYIDVQNYPKAIEAYKLANKFADAFKSNKIYYAGKLAAAYEKNKDIKNAESNYQKALKLADFDLGSRQEYVKTMKSHPMGPKHALEDSVDTNILELVQSLHGIGAFYLRQGNYKKSTPYFKRAKSIVDVWVPITFKDPKLFFDYSTLLAKQENKQLARKMNLEGKRIEARQKKQQIN